MAMFSVRSWLSRLGASVQTPPAYLRQGGIHSQKPRDQQRPVSALRSVSIVQRIRLGYGEPGVQTLSGPFSRMDWTETLENRQWSVFLDTQIPSR